MGALLSLAASPYFQLAGFVLSVFFGMMAFDGPRHWVEARFHLPQTTPSLWIPLLAIAAGIYLGIISVQHGVPLTLVSLQFGLALTLALLVSRSLTTQR